MPPNYREQQGRSLSANERKGAMMLVGTLAAAAVGVGVWAGVSTGGAPAGSKCVSVVVPSSTGGGYITRCGARARAWCATEPTGTGQLATLALQACRAEGLPAR
jgi:hypothetical protein